MLGPLYKIEYHSRAAIKHRKTVAGPVEKLVDTPMRKRKSIGVFLFRELLRKAAL